MELGQPGIAIAPLSARSAPRGRLCCNGEMLLVALVLQMSGCVCLKLPVRGVARREALHWSAVSSACFAQGARGAQAPPTAPVAEDALAASSLLRRRVSERVASMPDFGVESRDLYYPRYFAGSWDALSTTVSVDAPCGVGLFGGDAALARAREDVGVKVSYGADWIDGPDQSRNRVLRCTLNLSDWHSTRVR